jgi:APA family basic amino acid/polyamine antiporter
VTGGGREIGFWTAVALVVGNMIGSGVFLLPASLAPFGGLSFAGWAVSAGGSVLLALVFARFARANPAAGGPYAYTRTAFGELPGFLVGWGYWISVWCANAALAVAFVGYLAPFLPRVASSKDATAVAAIGAIWFFTLVNALGVRAAGRVQVATTILKVLPLAFVGLLGVAHFNADAFHLPAASTTGPAADLMGVVTLTLFAFLGLECATIPAGAVRDPARTIPRATIVGTLVAAIIYIVSTAGVMSLVPADALTASTAPFADAARALAGDRAAAFVAIGAAVSCLGALNGWTLVVGQMPMAMAADGAFPALFARLSARNTPVMGFVIGAVLSSLLIVVDLVQSRLAPDGGRTLVTLFTQMILLSTLSTLVPYFCCSLAALLSRGTGDATPGRRAGAGARTVAALALVYAVVAIVGAGGSVVMWGAALLVAGLPVYFWMMRRRSRPIAA